MEYDQEKIKHVCYWGLITVGGVVYSSFFLINLNRGKFDQKTINLQSIYLWIFRTT